MQTTQDLSWVKEIKTIESGFICGEGEKERAINEVNSLLQMGWKLITFATVLKMELGGSRQFTYHYYIMGR